MATKADLSGEVNEILGTDIQWDEMKKDDLKTFHMLVKEGHLLEPVAKHMAKEHGKDKLDRAVDEWRPGTIVSRLI